MRLAVAVPSLLQHWMPQPHLAAAMQALPGQASCAGQLWRASGSGAASQQQQHAAGSGSAARLMSSSTSSSGGASGVPEQTYIAAAKLTTLGANTTRSGYRESRPESYAQLGRADVQAAADDASSAPQTSQQQAGERPVDYYRLVRALFADEHVQKAGGVQLDEEAVVVLNKLVGSLTKEGKRSKANRILLDALHLIRESAAKDRAA